MIHRVTVDFCFPSPSKAKAAYLAIHAHLNQALTLNQGTDLEFHSHVERQKCHHDQVPYAPCERVEYDQTK